MLQLASRPHERGSKIMQITVRVGYTTVRPIVPDQHYSYVTVDAGGYHDASLQAAQWVASRPGVEMVTSTELERPAIVGNYTDTAARLLRALRGE
jgi:hypothetical protein